MPQAKKSRTLAYVRAQYGPQFSSSAPTLEDYLREAYETLTTGEERTFPVRGKTYVGVQYEDARSLNPSKPGFSLRIATSIEGQNASVVPHDRKQTQVETPETPPPAGGDFMNGDAHLHVQKNHVFYCASHLRIESIRIFLKKLFEAAELEKRATSLKLEPVASVDVVNQIRDEGIKAIGLNATMLKASNYRKESPKKIEQILHGMSAPLTSFFKKGKEIVDASKMEGLSSKVEFYVDGRKIKETSYNPLEAMSEDIVEELMEDNDLDSFYIKTQRGNTIRGSKLILHKSVKIPASGQTVDCHKAWKQLKLFKSRLVNDGKITQ